MSEYLEEKVLLFPGSGHQLRHLSVHTSRSDWELLFLLLEYPLRLPLKEEGLCYVNRRQEPKGGLEGDNTNRGAGNSNTNKPVK